VHVCSAVGDSAHHRYAHLALHPVRPRWRCGLRCGPSWPGAAPHWLLPVLEAAPGPAPQWLPPPEEAPRLLAAQARPLLGLGRCAKGPGHHCAEGGPALQGLVLPVHAELPWGAEGAGLLARLVRAASQLLLPGRLSAPGHHCAEGGPALQGLVLPVHAELPWGAEGAGLLARLVRAASQLPPGQSAAQGHLVRGGQAAEALQGLEWASAQERSKGGSDGL
jgi:hypothetical protein